MDNFILSEFEEQVNFRTQEILNQKIQKLRRTEQINSAFFIAIEAELGSEIAHYVVYECLNKGRLSCDYRTINSAYKKVEGNFHHRNMLKAISALYRMQFTDDKLTIYNLRTIVKHHTACDHCGTIAKKVQEYLDKNL